MRRYPFGAKNRRYVVDLPAPGGPTKSTTSTGWGGSNSPGGRGTIGVLVGEKSGTIGCERLGNTLTEAQAAAYTRGCRISDPIRAWPRSRSGRSKSIPLE